MYHTKKIAGNAFRISKRRGETAARLRVPGGHLEAKHLAVIRDIADRFGDGTVHLTTRQGFEIPGIRLSDMEKVKRLMAEMLREIEAQCGIVLDEPSKGYPSAGTRNVAACIGDCVCRSSNSDTTLLARKIEGAIYPNDYHLKVAVTGCPNDCIKAHLHDIGIISTVVPEYDAERCIACEACADNCCRKVTGAMRIEQCLSIRDDEYCLRCGECILKCPTGALSRGKQLYRVIVGGRTGKRNPRLANTFMQDASEEVVLALCRTVYSFIGYNIDKRLPKEHLGYIIDRVGFEVFVRDVVTGIAMNPEVRVVRPENHGYTYKSRVS